MVAALLHHSSFFFRLSSDVGVGKPNRPDDVEFVRFGIACCRTWMIGQGMAGNPRYLDFFDSSAGLPLTGGMDYRMDPTIRALQKSQKLTVDGIVSAVSQLFSSSGKPYTYAYLNKGMQAVYPKLFPRIDVVPESGLMVTLTVKGIFADKGISDKSPIV